MSFNPNEYYNGDKWDCMYVWMMTFTSKHAFGILWSFCVELYGFYFEFVNMQIDCLQHFLETIRDFGILL